MWWRLIVTGDGVFFSFLFFFWSVLLAFGVGDGGLNDSWLEVCGHDWAVVTCVCGGR